MSLSQGVRLGPYQIVAPLGAGGMGTVYKATDTRLGRTVAIKVLADRASCDPQRRLRFEQEARAVSTLNHPNICVLYDVGCETPSGGHPSASAPSTPSEPVQFLVMEHLEGETLSKRLREGGVSFDQALDIGAQVADALATAHRHGVIHRDLKPGNIMLTRSGAGVHAKLLDFGLAKLRSAPDPDFESTHSEHEPDTRPGAVLGTLPYMPPEQLEGRPTDARADIFALGCVLYEMLTGRRAFRGDSEASVISAIMTHEPDPLSTLQPATPAALDHLIRRCLQKDPDQRAESAHDLADELRWLREAYRTNSDSAGHPKRRAMDPASRSGQTVEAPPTPRSTRRGRRLAYALGLLAVGIASYAVPAYLRGWWPWSDDPLFRNAVPRRVTTAPGLQAEPAVSPLGDQIAYAWDNDGTSHIWLVDSNTGSRLQLTGGAEPDHDPAWDHGGGAVLFTRYRKTQRSIWTVPKFGGNATPLIDDAAQPAVSPDGNRLAFVREVSPSSETRVFVGPRHDLPRAEPITFAGDGLWGHSHPSWSPDGRRLCYQAQHALWVVSADGGKATRVTTDNESATDPVWSNDGRSIYYTSSREGTTALWRVAASGRGTPMRVTAGTSIDRQPSVSGDDGTLAWSAGPANLDIVLHDTSQGREETFGTAVQELMPRFFPLAQAVVFVSGQITNRNDLWVQPLDQGRAGVEARRLTFHEDGEVDHPAVSRDGRWVAYYRVVKGQRDVWVVPSDGGPPVRITTDPASDIEPAWNRDGTRLAFASDRGGHFNIWTVPVANGRLNGREVQVTHGDEAKLAPEWSPNDEWIAYISSPTSADAEVWVTRADGSDTPRRVTTKAGALRVRWPRENQMVVSGTWGERTLSLRTVDPNTGVARPLESPVLLEDDPKACDFDIDLDRRLAVFARSTTRLGNIWTLTKRR